MWSAGTCCYLPARCAQDSRVDWRTFDNSRSAVNQSWSAWPSPPPRARYSSYARAAMRSRSGLASVIAPAIRGVAPSLESARLRFDMATSSATIVPRTQHNRNCPFSIRTTDPRKNSIQTAIDVPTRLHAASRFLRSTSPVDSNAERSNDPTIQRSKGIESSAGEKMIEQACCALFHLVRSNDFLGSLDLWIVGS